jgi:hypothetical protein
MPNGKVKLLFKKLLFSLHEIQFRFSGENFCVFEMILSVKQFVNETKVGHVLYLSILCKTFMSNLHETFCFHCSF